jgi:hypothetical protein
VSDVCSMISLYSYLIPCMIRRVNLVPRHRFQYSIVSCMMSVDPEGRGSAQDTRVSLINAGMVLTPFFGTCQVQRRKEVGGPLWSEGEKSANSDD